MTFQRYKFQGMITRTRRVAAALDAPDDADVTTWNPPPGQMRRIVVRGEHHDTHGSHFFSALVAANDDGSDWLDDEHSIVTVMLAGDELDEYFCVGDHFALWLGHDVADGVITRRLFV